MLASLECLLLNPIVYFFGDSLHVAIRIHQKWRLFAPAQIIAVSCKQPERSVSVLGVSNLSIDLLHLGKNLLVGNWSPQTIHCNLLAIAERGAN